MKRIFQSVLMVFVGVSFILLSGCPKKITPPKRSSRVIRPAPQARPPKPPAPKPPADEGLSGTSTPLKEEEIPRIARLEESADPLVSKAMGQEEKTSALTDIFFELDQFAPNAIDLPIIEKNANWIIAHPNANVRIEGHGDSRGTNEYNLVLGEKRADSIKSALVKMGVESARLTILSYGEERPFCVREEDNCYQENRRAHFHVE